MIKTDRMSLTPPSQRAKAGAEPCLARSVADALAEEPSLEAVTIDLAHEKISVATLGRADVERLTQKVSTRIHSVQAADVHHECALLRGQAGCAVCDTPLSEAERGKITVKCEGGSTTIARVTCPTAPKFWRWRDLPWPRIEPKTIDYPTEDDHDHHPADEW